MAISPSNFSNDDKVQAMLSLLSDIEAYPYAPDTKRRLLTQLDKYAISYLLYELPEQQNYKFYCDKLDEYVIQLIKNELK